MRHSFRVLILGLCLLCNRANGGGTSPAEISNITVEPNGEGVKIAVVLTGSVSTRVLKATHPDRLVLELANTESAAKQRHIAVNRGPIKDIRIGLRSAVPLLTRMVVDTENALPYELLKVGNTVVLTVLPGKSSSGGNVLSSAADAMDPPSLSESANAAMPPVTTGDRKRTRIGFRVKYVADGAVYLTGGRTAGLKEGMKLFVRQSGKGRLLVDEDFVAVAELRVLSVAASSSVTEVSGAKHAVRTGDWAYLSQEDSEALSTRPVLSDRKQVPQVAEAFSPGLRVQIPKQEALDVGRVRARIGLDYSGISSRGSVIGTSSQVGLSARADITRIGGTYWNLEGYWRGRITKRSRSSEETLQDVLNKTYTMELDYDNPNSKWVAGFGRLYIPWANSLDTIDGGYVARRISKGVTAGMFAGSTPDPASWSYNPDRQIGGAFVNFEGGSFDSLRYTSTAGVALSGLKWDLDRPFVLFENGIYYKNSISIYHSLIADAPQGVSTNGITPGPGISRSYLTVHYQPTRRISFDLYHNYFRDVPTAARQLVGTGLVDKLLYQGFSVGTRIEPIRHVFVYTTLGQSDKTGDPRRTLNWMQGVTWEEIGRTELRADFRYSKFDSSFARGDYKVLTLSRHLGDRMMWDSQFGTQSLVSPFTINNKAFFVDSSLDMNLGSHSYFQSGFTTVRGTQASYNQWYLSLGYRFDGRPMHK